MPRSLGRPRVSASVRGGVVVAKVSGLVTLDVVRSIRDDLAPLTIAALVLVLDYRRSAIALTDSDLFALAPPSSALDVPAVWLVSSVEVAEQWRRQALRFALVGRRRFVCLDRVEAMAWACHQARLRQASA